MITVIQHNYFYDFWLSHARVEGEPGWFYKEKQYLAIIYIYRVSEKEHYTCLMPPVSIQLSSCSILSIIMYRLSMRFLHMWVKIFYKSMSAKGEPGITLDSCCHCGTVGVKKKLPYRWKLQPLTRVIFNFRLSAVSRKLELQRHCYCSEHCYYNSVLHNTQSVHNTQLLSH